ncbi:J domain-containing protein [Aquabacterium sp.]|uniref:J domain-containing protein n=1 Tax=Aquabacterium TaxID=92793 RepID=UPI001D93F093|nr:J domain-containing protein [Aquabacterium sp.]MBT9608876.1 J domain-containing protein [Aquabacterium sp.]
MNHYERLKVTQDAPPEVVRAAYRALANRLHPDRNGGVGGPDDAAHEQMASLNAAYEILIDPLLRRDYDATLEPMRVTAARPLSEAHAAASFDGAAASSMGDSQLERPWQGQQPLTSRTVWAPSPKHIVLGGGIGAVVVALVVAALWRMDEGEHPLDRSIAAHAIRQPGVAQDHMTPSGQPTAVVADVVGGVRRPTVEELSRMSDEELVKALPALDDQPAPSSAAVGSVAAAVPARGPHMLDGSPIRLRVETSLVDPLAPAPADPRQP